MPLEIDNVSPSPQSAPISGATQSLPEWIKVPSPPQQTLRKMFDDSRTMSNPTRLKAQTWRDYYDGPGQLKSEVRRVLRMRGQPAIWTNRVQPAIDGVLGMLENSKVDPRAYPRNPSPEDENLSDIATKSLRYIADKSDFENTLLDCAENFLIEGTEAAIVEADGTDIPITQIRFEEFFADPFSRRADFKDAKYMGIAQWKDASEVKAAWPQQYAYMGDPIQGGGGPNGAIDSTWQDRPNNFIPWIDMTRQRMMVVEIYYNQDRGDGAKWYHCIYCAAGVFVHELSPFLDSKGLTLNPIEAESCYVDRENNRYGRVLNMMPIQDEVNARRSRALHLTNSRQIQERELGAAQVDSNEARKEAARADGVIPSGWQLVPTSDMSDGNMALLQEAKGELERMGPTPQALDLAQGSAVSGRARMVVQQAGMTELARCLGRHDDFRQRIYRAAWARAQQFWKAPMWIRVTDEVKAPEFLRINEPVFDDAGQAVPEIDPQTGQPKLAPATGPDGQAVADPTTGQPQMQMVQKVNNRIGEMDMDIIVTSTPDTVNLQQEVFADLMGIVEKVGMQAVFSPEFALIIEMSPLQDKAAVLEKIKAAQGDNDPKLQAAQQRIEELTQALQNAMQGDKAVERQKTISEAERNMSQATLYETQAVVTALTGGIESVPELPPLPGDGGQGGQSPA